MAGRNLTEAQREAADQARRETVEQLHDQLAHGIANVDEKEAWQRWLGMASKLHRYSFNNVMLTGLNLPWPSGTCRRAGLVESAVFLRGKVDGRTA
jgi:hypothetical protein